jgi:hypothetical protein
VSCIDPEHLRYVSSDSTSEGHAAHQLAKAGTNMIPVELYRRIVEHVEHDDLFDLLVVSPVFQDEAERLIHREPSFDYLVSPSQIDRACRRLLSIPRLWPLVRLFNIYISDLVDYDAFDYLPSLSLLLENLTNLSALVLVDHSFPLFPLKRCGDLLTRCTFQLQALECQFALDAEFVAFLSKQKSLKYLAWEPMLPPSLSLPPEAIPDLAALRSRSYFALESIPAVVAGRPLTHVEVSGHWDTGVLPSFMACTVPLKALHLDVLHEKHLLALPSLFPALEFLSDVNYRVIDVSSFDSLEKARSINKSHPKEAFFLSKIIPNLKHLLTVVATQRHGEDPRYGNDTVAKLHTACPTLRLVNLAYNAPATGARVDLVFDREENTSLWTQHVHDHIDHDLWLESAFQ